ncbi:MAG: S8 family serine peptidase [Pseudomonadota bacterium]
MPWATKLSRALVLLLAGFATACTADPSADPGQAAGPEVTDPRELIVLTAPPTDLLIARAQARGYVLRTVYPLDELGDELVVFQIPPGLTIAQAIAEIEADVPGVTAGAHHVYYLQASTPADRNYAGPLMRWPETGCRAMQRIGIIDAGVAASHPALIAGRITQERFVAGDQPPVTDHGSLMADLLIGPGRLADAALFSANVVDPAQGDGDAAGVVSILRAVDWMRLNDVALVNISLAGPRNKLMNRALGRAASDGMVFVAAAGNSGPGAPPQFPAAFAFVLAVTAIDQDQAVYAQAVRGDHIDVAAPGVDILVPSAGGLKIKSGTSVAAPFVTAALAADPQLANTSIERARRDLRARAMDLGSPGWDPVFGAGLVLAPEGCLG